MYKTKILITILIITLITGCASPARVDKMIATNNDVVGDEPLTTSLSNNIHVISVLGGEKTNPLWTSEIGNEEFKMALESSLRNAGLYNAIQSSGKYELTATLLEVNQPLFGASLTVTMKVRYTLIDSSSRNALMDSEIYESYTAKFSDSFLAVERLRLANEGSARINIARLIDELYRLKIDDN